MIYRIKVVPRSDPNADGEWLTVAHNPTIPLGSFKIAALALAQHVPEGYEMVSYVQTASSKVLHDPMNSKQAKTARGEALTQRSVSCGN